MAKSKIPNEIFLINQLHIFNDIAFLNKICSSENRKGLIVLLLLEFFPWILWTNFYHSNCSILSIFFLTPFLVIKMNLRSNLNLRSRKRRIKKKSARSKCVFPRDNFSLVLCTVREIGLATTDFVRSKQKTIQRGGRGICADSSSIDYAVT